MNFLWNIYPKKVLKVKYIAHKVGRLMDSAKTEGLYTSYAPSRFKVGVAKEDFLRIEPVCSSVTSELVDFINRHAEKHNYKISGEPEVIFEEKEDLPPGDFTVEPVYPSSDDTLDHINTMVFNKEEFSEVKQQYSQKLVKNKLAEIPVLEMLEGNDAGLKYDLLGEVVTLGRKEDNQVMINDPNVSRYHARIIFDKEWRIEDLNSTNGIFVNDKRVKKSQLKHGDEIRMGSTLMKFRMR